MDDDYQNEAEYQNEGCKSDIVEEELSHIWGVHSALARTESVASDQGYENDEQEYESIKFPDMRMRKLPEIGVKTEPALIGSKVDKWRCFGRECLVVVIFVSLIFSLIMAAAGILMACLKCFSACPDDWQKFDDKCYYFPHKKDTWGNTRSACKDLHADLIVINNEKEQKILIYKMNSTSDVWLGLSYIEAKEEWIWVDATNLSYTSWKSSKPSQLIGEDGFPLHCMIAEKEAKYKWSNTACRKRHQSICEKKSQVVCVLQSPRLP
ncbi:C-type lectin lectoxin-Phi1-like [Hemicordylus capensis]|uniref:C-type lectin lectoxin-Phi1-like n=1 Tax=Hemicordylus capensis TaxID=884348 RepID=UPI0023040C54|nr:C-type lectin lectoxin-Phi1-like [Hemicordylus capensis]